MCVHVSVIVRQMLSVKMQWYEAELVVSVRLMTAAVFLLLSQAHYAESPAAYISHYQISRRQKPVCIILLCVGEGGWISIY